MAKKEIPSVKELSKYLSKQKLFPIYFIFGEDDYSINNAVESIKKVVEPFIHSEFDKEVINPEKNQNLNPILDIAFAFPFGGGKKLIILKNFEMINNKKELINYINHPQDFTILVVIQNSKVSDFSKEPYLSLFEKKYLFEARTESGKYLIDWVTNKANSLGLKISADVSRSLVEIVGEDKNILDMQLQKLFDYKADQSEITLEDVKKISSPTKEYSIFDFQEVLGVGNKAKALEIAFNLLDSGQEIVFIINMISKFVLTVSQIFELVKSNINDNEAAKMLDVSWYYYKNCKNAHFLLSDRRLLNASKALLAADISVKTTNTDPRDILLVLISEMMK